LLTKQQVSTARKRTRFRSAMTTRTIKKRPNVQNLGLGIFSLQGLPIMNDLAQYR